MNYFAHARDFLDDPYFAAGTAVPDLLTVADRRVRLRRKHVLPFVDDPDPAAASVARGILQHLADDARFHGTRAFAELSLGLTAAVRNALGEERGFRPSFLGHLLLEVLLDASLAAENPDRLEAYYRSMDSVVPGVIEEAVNRMSPRSTDRLAGMVLRFCRERFLWDYLEDAKLLVRLNQVMRRAKLRQLPESFREVLPQARRRVDDRRVALLEGIPVRASEDKL